MNRKDEIQAVRELGEKIGYGNMMELASAMWAVKLLRDYGSSEGAFVPTILSDLKRKPREQCKFRQAYIKEQVMLKSEW